MGVQAGSGKVFNWFTSMASVAGLMTWFGTCYTYTRFYAGMKVQGIDRKTLPFASSLQPFAAWYALIWCLVICLVRLSVAIHHELNIDKQKPPDWLTQFSGWSVFLRGNWNTATFITSYLPQAMFPIMYAGAKFWRRTPTVRPSEMDFYSGLAEIEADTYDEPPPRNKMEAFWQWLVSDEIEGSCMGPLIASIDVRGRYLSCIISCIELFDT